MKVIVTGATGFIGRRLVRHLIDGGHTVAALTRNVAGAKRVLPVRCQALAWRPGADALDSGALRGTDVIVHLAGEGVAEARWSAQRKRAIHDSRVVGTRLLVDSIATLPAAERPRALISASAIGIYGDRRDDSVDEDSGPGSGFLADVCRTWEAEALRAEAHGLRVAVIRVGIVLGSDGGALGQMLPPFRLGLGGRLGSGRQWMSWIHVHDLVRMFRFAIEHDAASGIINGVSPEAVINADFTRELGRALGRPTLVPVPGVVLQLALGEMASMLLTGQRVQAVAARRLDFTYEYPRLQAALRDLCSDLTERLEAEQWVPEPPEKVFPFFADARNLEQITPAFLHFSVKHVSTPALQTGTLIDHQLRLHGLPVRWQSRIDRWEPNRAFVDSQTRGPYALWRHTHEFEPFADGTIIRDRVCYALPLAPLGSIVAGSLVTRDLQAIFDFRRAQIAARFGDDASLAARLRSG
ncbi:MAG TPA: TIGR01777 family oxidoreductase [Candidatus Binatia bacterium]|nr:TIGR01777 family oxidoreductase [Candidatus Binatia bacterium]